MAEQAPSAVLDVTSYLIEKECVTGHEHAFRLTTQKGPYLFSAENAALLDGWFNAITAVRAYLSLGLGRLVIYVEAVLSWNRRNTRWACGWPRNRPTWLDGLRGYGRRRIAGPRARGSRTTTSRRKGPLTICHVSKINIKILGRVTPACRR